MDYADEDNIQYASYTINGGYNALETRKDNTIKAKDDKGFNVYSHYKETHKNGTEDQAVPQRWRTSSRLDSERFRGFSKWFWCSDQKQFQLQI